MSEVAPTTEPSTPTAGPLTLGVLPGLLRWIYVKRRSGMLHFTRENERGSVCFISGRIMFGGANIPECLMGETFVRHGLLTREQLEQALEASRDPAKRLGQALLELGFMDRSALDRALALHVREILMCVFSWAHGAYAFEEQPAETLAAFDRPLPLSTAEVILDAVWSVADAEVVRAALGDLDRVLVPASDPLLRFQRVELTPDDGFLLSRVDGTLTAREIIEISSTGREQAERSLFGLLCVGMIDFGPSIPSRGAASTRHESVPAREPPAREELAAAGAEPSPAPSTEAMRRSIEEAHAALATRDHYEVLGVSRGATPAEVKAAFYRLVKRFHPDTQHDPLLADLRGKIEAVFARINDAYQALADPKRGAAHEAALPAVRRPEPERASPSEPEQRRVPEPGADAGAGPERVEAMLRKSEELFAAGNYWEALQLAHSIVSVAEGLPKQRARMLAARAYLKHPGHAKEAEDELRAAVQENRRNTEALFLLGTLYEAAGAPDRAEMMFRKTLAVDPRHSAARAKLGGAPTPERPQRGILGRLLGRS